MDSQTTALVSSVIRIAPELAKAIVAAQRAVDSIERDGNGDKGRYATADAIAAEARRVLTEHGAAWMRLDVDLEEPGLTAADIGNQDYVGDVVERWAIVHESGAGIMGSSRMPVIASRGRPHDKAVGASLTYDVGGALRGALCLDREPKDNVDGRSDKDDGTRRGGARKPKPDASATDEPDIGPRCRGKAGGIAKAIDDRSAAVARLLDRKDPGSVYRSALKSLVESKQVDVAKYGGQPKPTDLTIADGNLVAQALATKLADLETKALNSIRAECVKMYGRLVQADPDFTEDNWRDEWARFAGIGEWPENPGATHENYTAALAGMRGALERIEA